MIPNFEIIATDKNSKARAGVIHTPHGDIATPVFMPVGTQATVKGLTPDMLNDIGVEILLGNTYHLALRPGEGLIQLGGGLHKFMNWPKPILTDSGGYQVFSLSSLRKISESGVEFRNHHNGDLVHFSPERVLDIQRALGSDIMMVLDVCPDWVSPSEEIDQAVEQSIRWAERSYTYWQNNDFKGQQLFAIQQGGLDVNKRQHCTERLLEYDFSGFAIGGLSVGEPKEKLWELIPECTRILPENKPRYLMGVGQPEDLDYAIAQGVDMFDCVIPTRLARHGNLLTSEGKINLNNAQYRADFGPLDPNCKCKVCGQFSRAYVKHLQAANEILGLVLASYHNVYFLVNRVAQIRKEIIDSNGLSDIAKT